MSNMQFVCYTLSTVETYYFLCIVFILIIYFELFTLITIYY